MSRILIATDAWHPQVSGVVRTLDTTARVLRGWGHTVEMIEPTHYPSFPTPFYPEIPISYPRPGRVYERVLKFRPDHVHISTEGMLGLLVRRFCRKMGWNFSTSYHTRFPEYLKRLAWVPERLTYRFLRWFHSPSSAMMVATPSLEKELVSRGFRAPMKRWSRGVDLEIFRPRRPSLPSPLEGEGSRAAAGEGKATEIVEVFPSPGGEAPPPSPSRGEGIGSPPSPTGKGAGGLGSFARPVLLYVGRVSHEKGIADFLDLRTPGTKVVVGDGPARAGLEKQYPDAIFLGYRRGQELGEVYAAADLFVFPSKTDTFGVVVIEALASGLPVAAYPVTGPADIIRDEKLGALDNDLGNAVSRALATGDPAACAAEGATYTRENCTRQFLANLVPARGVMRR
jgi:glycosyltransferase involved in cell wall biosynthesis